jgi:p-aminobenzoyl-glutamate transporter AbgT
MRTFLSILTSFSFISIYVLSVFKIEHVINWSWWLVLTPFYLSLIALIIIYFIVKISDYGVHFHNLKKKSDIFKHIDEKK